MYLMSLINRRIIFVMTSALFLLVFLGIFTYSKAEFICDNCNINVEFKGIYKEGTCTISVNGGSENETVKLPTISAQTLSSAGNEAGATKFTVALNNCPVNVNVDLYFKSSGNLASGTMNLLNSPGANFAKDVELRLRDMNLKHIRIDDPVSAQRYIIPGLYSSVSKDYYVSYFAGSNSVSAGNVQSKTILEVVYK